QQATELLIGPLAIGDVTDGGRDEKTVGRLEGAEGDLGGELAAVAAAGEQLEAGAHRTDLGGGGVRLTSRGVRVPDGLGEKDLDRLADEFVAVVAEQALRLAVDQTDPAVG